MSADQDDLDRLGGYASAQRALIDEQSARIAELEKARRGDTTNRAIQRKSVTDAFWAGDLDCDVCGCFTNNGTCTGCSYGFSPFVLLRKERDALSGLVAKQSARIAELEGALEAIAPYLPSLDEGPVRFSAHAIAAGMCRAALASGKGTP